MINCINNFKKLNTNVNIVVGNAAATNSGNITNVEKGIKIFNTC